MKTWIFSREKLRVKFSDITIEIMCICVTRIIYITLKTFWWSVARMGEGDSEDVAGEVVSSATGERMRSCMIYI